MAIEQKCISVSREFAILAEENKVSWSEAARVGMSLLLAEKGVKDYDNNLNLFRKMQTYQKQAEEALQKINELEQKYEAANNTTLSS